MDLSQLVTALLRDGITTPTVVVGLLFGVVFLWRDRTKWLDKYITQVRECADQAQEHSRQLVEVSRATERLIELSGLRKPTGGG